MSGKSITGRKMKIVWHSCHLYWCDPVLFSLRNWRRIQSIRYKNIPGRKWPAQRTEKALYKNILIINSQSIGKLMMWMLHKTFKLSCSSSPLILLPWSFSVMGRQQLKITSYKNSIKSQLQKKKKPVCESYVWWVWEVILGHLTLTLIQCGAGMIRSHLTDVARLAHRRNLEGTSVFETEFLIRAENFQNFFTNCYRVHIWI